MKQKCKMCNSPGTHKDELSECGTYFCGPHYRTYSIDAAAREFRQEYGSFFGLVVVVIIVAAVWTWSGY